MMSCFLYRIAAQRYYSRYHHAGYTPNTNEHNRVDVSVFSRTCTAMSTYIAHDDYN